MSKGNSRFFNTIDWYITKKIFLTFLVSIALLSFIIVIFDLSAKLDDFIDHNAPMSAVLFDYYLNVIPHYVNMFGHLFFFISVVFVTSRLTARSETVAVLCGGIPFKRFLRPFITGSVVLGVFGLYLSNFLLPQVNVNIYNFEQRYYREKFNNAFVDIHLQTTDSTQVYVHHYNNHTQQGYMFTQETFCGNVVKEKIFADAIQFDSVNKQWKVFRYNIRTIDGRNEQLSFCGDTFLTLNGLLPNDFNKILKTEQLDFNQLNTAIDRETMKGTSLVRDLYIEKYQRLFTPLSYIILTVIAVCLSCKKTRGGTGLNLALAIGLAFSLILLMKVFNSLSTNGTLAPVLAPLIPLTLYSLIALYLLKIAPK
ncbi:MAG: LptF/LptG family permease [Bacteroidales bacterium]|nr:LptF/LptG family permease [Bacteroidales bacterium]